ncbi:hypothetical protein BGZ59_005347 [Podila verticillata]|nr:hypothetical protein BGZ59_005347 [Podila verticillata]
MPPSPPLEASASKAKATTPFSATTASYAQKQNTVDTLEVPTNQESSVALRSSQDERYQGPSPLAPYQTSSANKNRPHVREPSELPQGSPIPISAPRDNLIQASPELHKRGWSTGSLSRKLKTDPRTEYSSTPPSERISGYKAMPSRDMYPEAPLPGPKLTPSMRHDHEGMWIQNLDGRSPRSPTLSLESRGRAGSLPGYLVHPLGFQRDGIPPPRTAGSLSGTGSLKDTVSFSPSNSTTLPAIPSLSSSSSLSPPLVKLGQEGYYRLKDLEQLFQIWKAEHEQRLSRPGRDDHHHHHFTGGQDDSENMENHGGSSSNNGTATPTGPSWREKAKWKLNAVLQEYGSDGKKRKTMNDHRAGRTEDVDEDLEEHGARGEEVNGREGGEGREDGQVDEFGDDPMEEDEDSDEDDYETDPQGESRKRQTDSAGDTSESGLTPEAHEQQMSRDPRQYKMNHHPTGSSGPGTQPASSSSGTPLDSTLGVLAPSKKRRFRVRESKNHECKICGKRFSRPSQLQTHSFTHSGEKPHQCHMCYKHFNVASNLKRHIRTHASSCRKSSRLGNTVFRGFALGYPTRTHNESTHTSESIANTNPRQEESNTDDNNRHGHPESSGAQGHATRVRRTERPAIKHPLVTDSTEASQSNGSPSGSSSSTSGVPVMPPTSAPSYDPGCSQASGRKGSGQGRKGRIDDGESVELPISASFLDEVPAMDD